MSLPLLHYHRWKYPEAYIYFVINKKVSQCAPLFINHSMIDKIIITDNWEDNAASPREMKIKSECDLVFNITPPVHIHEWYNQFDCVEMVWMMAGMPLEALRKECPESLRKPKLTPWWKNTTMDYSGACSANSIAIWPFAGYGTDNPRNLSPAWFKRLVEELECRGYKAVHFGHSSEPDIGASYRMTDLSFFEQIRLSVACGSYISSDSGSGWVLGAYGLKGLHLVRPWFSNHNSNLLALAPVNENGVDILCDREPKPSFIADEILSSNES